MIRSLALILMMSFFGTVALAEPSMMDVIETESTVVKFNETGYSFVLAWQLGPKRGESRFTMRTWKNDLGTMNGPFQDLPQALNVVLWMPSMGHGSAPTKVSRVAPGEYDVSNVQFIMGGRWDIKFQLKQGNTVVDEAIVSLSL